MKARERHRMRLIKYLSDTEKDFPRRKEYGKMLGVSLKTIYQHFTPIELSDIESEAIDIRKRNSVRQRTVLYKTLYNEGKNGNVPAIKEFLDRTEGAVTKKSEVTGKDGSDLIPKSIGVEYKKPKAADEQ